MTRSILKPYILTRPSRQEKLHIQAQDPRLPPDMLLEIAQCLAEPRNILQFCLTSSSLYFLLLPALYASVEYKGSNRCAERLEFLIRRPDLAHYIQKLILRPNHLLGGSQSSIEAELSITRALELLAPNLRSLHTFIWDGLEMPEDHIWATLRLSCPRLKYVGSSVGDRPIPPESEVTYLSDEHLAYSEYLKLFNFSSLVGFSLTSKWQARADPLLPWDDILYEALPENLWEMLLDRSDQLQELVFGGENQSIYNRLFDVRPLIRGNWPRLHSLILGRTMMQDVNFWDHDTPYRDLTNDFNHFLHSHPTLKRLDLPYPSRYPKIDLTGSNIRLESYSGSLPYLIDILGHCELKSLRLCTEQHPSWYIPYVRRILGASELHFLTSLDIWIDLSHPTEEFESEDGFDNPESREKDHIKVFCSVLASCRSLLHFKVNCSTRTKHGFLMRDFWKALEGGPELKTLQVFKVYVTGEEGMVQSALNMAYQLPSLEQISLHYSLNSWSTYVRPKLKQTGTYDFIQSGTGELVRVIADERGSGFFRPFSRRYERKVRRKDSKNM